IAPDGTGHRLLFPTQDTLFPGYLLWSNDGNTIYFKANDLQARPSIWSIPLTGGAPKLMVTFDDPLRPFLRWEFAASATEFFFTIAERDADIRLLQLQR